MADKKKDSGLSKKIPSIFKGLPDLDAVPAAPKQGAATPEVDEKTPAPIKQSVKPAAAPVAKAKPAKGRKVRFLFEIGDAQSRVIVSRQEGDDWKILKTQTFTHEADERGMAQRDAAELTEWLQTCVSDFAAGDQFDTRIMLTGQGLFMREIDKPAVEAKGMEDAVVWAIAEDLPFPVEESRVVYEEKPTTVVVAAVEHNQIDEGLEAVHNASIYPSQITLLPVGLEAAGRNYGVFPSKNALVMHVGGDQTSLVVLRDNEFHSMRDVSIGGETVTRAMMGTLVVESAQVTIQYAEAKALKEALGLPTADLMPDPREPKLSQLSVRVRPVFEKLVAELRSSLVQFQKEFPSEGIEAIYLVGVEANLKGFDAYISGQVQLPVEIVDLTDYEAGLSPAFVALAGLNYSDGRRFNFGTFEDIWKPRLETYREYVKKGGVVLAGVLVLAFLFSGMQVLSAQLSIQLNKHRIAQMGPAAKKLTEIEKLTKELKTQYQMLEEAAGPQLYLGAVLREISRIIPLDVVLTEISLSRDEGYAAINFSGVIRSSRKPPDVILSEFLRTLNQSKFFGHSKLRSRSVSDEEDDDEEMDARPDVPLSFVINSRLAHYNE